MTTRLSDELRQAIEERGGATVYVVDATTNASYVLMRAEQFEKISALVDGIETMYPLLAEIESDYWDDKPLRADEGEEAGARKAAN